MPVKPSPYKLVCPQCGHTKIVSPKSDVLSPKELMDMSPICPKCRGQMEGKGLNLLDDIFSIFKR